MGFCQEVLLPAAAAYNGDQTYWDIDTVFKLPTGMTQANSFQLVKGDYIYVVGPTYIYRGNLITKLWDATNYAHGMYSIYSVLWSGPDENLLTLIGATYTNQISYVNIGQLNVDSLEYLIVNKTEFVNGYTWANQNQRYDHTYSTAYRWKYGLSLYDKDLNIIYFTCFDFVGSNNSSPYGYACAYSDNYTHFTYCRHRNSLGKYDLNLNTITFYDLSAGHAYNGGALGDPINYINSWWSTFKSERLNYSIFNTLKKTNNNTLLFINNINNPRLTREFSLQTMNWTGTTYDCVMPYFASSEQSFGDKELYFNGNVGVVYDVDANEFIRPAIPYTVTAPQRKNLNLYKDKIIFLTGDSLYSLPYFGVDLTETIVLWRLNQGQQFCGEHDLIIYDSKNNGAEKLTITQNWQTATKDIDIIKGEYSSLSQYRMLVNTN